MTTEYHEQFSDSTRDFYLVESGDHITPLTGATPTVELSKNENSFQTAQGTVTELGNGWYQISLTQFDTQAIGSLIFHITAAGGDPTDFEDVVYAAGDVVPEDGSDRQHLHKTPSKRSYLLVDNSDHITGLTGLSPTVQLSKASSVFANAAGTSSEIGYGWYVIALTDVDTDTLGSLKFAITASGADQTDFQDTVVATLSGTQSLNYRVVPENAYSSVSLADKYFEDRLFTELWQTETEENRRRALIQATALIDRLRFQGDKADASQTLEFPRGTDTTVPQHVVDATYEIAYALLDGRDIEHEAEHRGTRSATLGPSRISYDATIVDQARAHSIPSAHAWALLKPYLRDGRHIGLDRVS